MCTITTPTVEQTSQDQPVISTTFRGLRPVHVSKRDKVVRGRRTSMQAKGMYEMDSWSCGLHIGSRAELTQRTHLYFSLSDLIDEFFRYPGITPQTPVQYKNPQDTLGVWPVLLLSLIHSCVVVDTAAQFVNYYRPPCRSRLGLSWWREISSTRGAILPGCNAVTLFCCQCLHETVYDRGTLTTVTATTE